MSNSNANIGWFFSKDYYRGLHNGMSDNVEKKNEMITVVVGNCLVPQNDDEKQVIKQFFNKKNDDIINCNVNLGGNPSLNCSSFVLETIYPGLLIGTGNIHETGMLGECKLGLQFDYTTGLPYIPGSSVKGLLRSMFPYSIPKTKKGVKYDTYRKQRSEYIKELLSKRELELTDADVEDLEMQLFAGEKNEKSIPIYERCIFYDAMINGYNEEKGILGLDYITPHLEPLKNPTPIQFMKILPEVRFQFQFRIPDNVELKSGVKVSQDDVLNLFKNILMGIGIGAKTNVGYGQLVEVTSTTKKASHIQRIQQTKDVKAQLLKLNGEWQITIKDYHYAKVYSLDRETEKKLGKVRPNIPISIMATVQISNNKISKIIKINKE